MQEEKRDDIQPTLITDPSYQPTVEEVEARSARETSERVASATDPYDSARLLARIEPEGRELYYINESLEKALLLSIAISLRSAAPGPKLEPHPLDKVESEPDFSGTAIDDGEDNTNRQSKPVRRKMVLPKSGGGKAGKGRDDKSKSSAASGVRHWDKPPTRKGRR